jgi:hypothetical protein
MSSPAVLTPAEILPTAAAITRLEREIQHLLPEYFEHRTQCPACANYLSGPCLKGETFAALLADLSAALHVVRRPCLATRPCSLCARPAWAQSPAILEQLMVHAPELVSASTVPPPQRPEGCLCPCPPELISDTTDPHPTLMLHARCAVHVPRRPAGGEVDRG